MLSVDVVLIALSVAVILVFGHRQFNQWTESESKREASEPELLAFAPPNNFTSFGRFTLVSALYCLTLVALYGILYAIFSNPRLGRDFLDVPGVTPDNAWIIALFIVTGLSPMLPVFSNIERSVREVMHAWAFVPGKAHQMATEIASPTTRFDVDQAYVEDFVLPRLARGFSRDDFTEGSAPTPANKWARLNYLLFKYAPTNEDGLNAPQFRSPYVIRFRQDFTALKTEIDNLASKDFALLRNRPNSPDTLAMAEKIDWMLHRLYVLMSCRAFGTTRPWDGAVKHFRRAYGITVVATQGAAFPSGPVFDALFIVALVVFGASVAFVNLVPAREASVNPVVWALSALCIHGLGVLVGWKTFEFRRSRREIAFIGVRPLSREHLVSAAVLGYSAALLPTWLAATYYARNDNLSVVHMAGVGFALAWPWALFGAATALVTYFHLGRTANKQITLRVQALSAATQGALYLALAVTILATHKPMGLPSTLADRLADPVVQLVLLQTILIGLLLGIFLPSALHGQGDDRRGGVPRHDLSRGHRRAVLTLSGRQIEGSLREMSLSGCVVRLPAGALPRPLNGYGNLTLDDGTSVPSILTREAGVHADRVDVAVRFSSERGFRYLPSGLRRHLQRYLSGYPRAAVDEDAEAAGAASGV